MWEGPVYCGGCHLGQVVLGCIKKQAWASHKEHITKQNFYVVYFSVCHELQPGLPSVTAFKNKMKKPFLLQKLLWSMTYPSKRSKTDTHLSVTSQQIPMNRVGNQNRIQTWTCPSGCLYKYMSKYEKKIKKKTLTLQLVTSNITEWAGCGGILF